MDAFDTKIFGKKTLSNLMKEIYDTQKKRDSQILGLIMDLKPLVKDLGDATLLVPLIKDYLDMGLKNDDQLIKLATIIQRIVTSNSTSNGDGLTISEEEKKQLLLEYKKVSKE